MQLILFIALLLLWNTFIPFLEGADEAGHFCHADYIAHRGKIPNLNIRDGCFLVYQPLYYLTLVPVIKAFGLPELKLSSLAMNPNWDDLRNGQYSQFIHTKHELLFNWGNFQVLIHTLRLISVACGILIFLIAWKVSKIVFADQKYRYLSLILFFNPMFLHIFSTLTNVVLVSLLASGIIGLDLYYLERKKPAKIGFIQGILFGFGIITKINILALMPAYIFLLLKNRQTFKSKTVEAFLMTLGILITSGWYMLRSFNLYGEFLEINIARGYAGEYHWTLLQNVGPLNFWYSFTDTFFRTFWSGFGALTVQFPQIVNIALLILTLLVSTGIIIHFKRMNIFLKAAFYYFLTAFLGLIIVNFRTSSMHAKDVFTAYIPLAFLFSFGFSQIIETIRKRNLNPVIHIIIPVLTFLYYAESEIVNVLKIIVGKQNFSTNIPLVIFAKLLITVILYKLVTFLITKVNLNEKFITKATVTIFLLDIIILSYSVYLFYFKFA